ncbi:SDR family NAD(P)-dependent oxidoreductase [Agrococcus sp. SGAir0287]|uniref:SDR family NAD(P)-dependent oxidoreductase n=1 Tax=Agrococcus sp. SGAir0287 TaxID=2070347 RepID=UPI0010CD0286|nr:SDR family NAD(P)-dependent oxidoreductase [Agrococcus sp. SGAir0287]QCR19126.1 short-chain dehydrogenase [Agrococcus sp. SGAir0287]
MVSLRSPSRSPRVAVVAGGSRGLGLLIALELVRRGWSVAVCARGEVDVEHALRRLERAARGRARMHGSVCDVASASATRSWIESVEHDLGPIDAAFAVAGVIDAGPAETMRVEDFDLAIDVMLRGPIHVAWAVLPGMRRRRRGRIGIVSSIGGAVSVPHLLPYAAAKAGAIGFAEGLATELAGTGVTATTIVPGLMRTGGHEAARFRGRASREAAWFTAAASLPLLSTSAPRAARRMVDGVLAGRTHVRLPWWTHVAMRVHGVAPATTVRVAGLVGRLLPGAGSRPDAPTPGRRVSAARRTAALTVLGARAARRHGTRER